VNFYSASKYLKYMLFSSHRRGHGVHSPFVFNLITSVFRNKTEPGIVLSIESLRKRMLEDSTILNVADYGSGSKQMKENLRKISDIARYSSVPKKYGLLLHYLAREFGNSGILELGTSLGISAMYMASGVQDTPVYTIEGSSEVATAARSYIDFTGIGNINISVGRFDDELPTIREKGFTPGLVFIDGDHRKESVIRYFKYIAEFSGEDSVIVIDDIYSSPEMGEAWDLIRQNERVSITVDIFRMGLVFFRKGITRTDYVIRY
jgi:predicted O-methyltransferase YrrM